MASWAGVRLCSFSPEGAGFPCAGPGEEVINDRGARRGECSGLMLVLIRSWSPATDRIQPGPCVCVCVLGSGGQWRTRNSWLIPSASLPPHSAPTSLALVLLEVPSAVCPPPSC